MELQTSLGLEEHNTRMDNDLEPVIQLASPVSSKAQSTQRSDYSEPIDESIEIWMVMLPPGSL